MPNHCATKDRLITDLERTHRWIVDLHTMQMDTLMKGTFDFDLDADLEKKLQHARNRWDSVMRGIRAHMADHHC